MKLLRAIVNCDQIVTVSSNGDLLKVGPEQDRVDMIERRAQSNVGCAIVFGQGGEIVSVGHDDEVLRELSIKFGVISFNDIGQVIDGVGCSLIPGLIDAHSHPVWAGDRVNEFDLKLRGASYLEIHNQGGGIHYTVEQTRNASEDHLLGTLLQRVERATSCGTTVLECKTGYGLDLDSELKMLRVIERARHCTRTELVSTFLGAHSVPKGMTAEEGVRNVIDMMDNISALGQAVEFVDVFCEKGPLTGSFVHFFQLTLDPLQVSTISNRAKSYWNMAEKCSKLTLLFMGMNFAIWARVQWPLELVLDQ